MNARQIQVEGTNDSSIVSKLSMVERGYFSDPYIKFFVKKSARRSPLINRCYHLRAAAVSRCVKKFLSDDLSSEKQLISLGAGFDTTYFRMQYDELLENVKFVEIDFPEVMKRKVALAVNAGLIQAVNVNEFSEVSNIIHKSDGYICVGYDLREVGEQLKNILKSIGIDFQKPTLVLSEVVLCYLSSKKSSFVIEWLSKEFKNMALLVFEQSLPNDSFGQVMCKHFKQIGSPLRTIHDFPTISSHIERHKDFGFHTSSASTIDGIYYNCISEEERRRIESLEIFDEFEAFHRACQHYFIMCSTNCKTLMNFCREAIPSSVQENDFTDTSIKQELIGRTEVDRECIRRYGHCTCSVERTWEDGSTSLFSVTFGGFGISNNSSESHRRLTNVAVVDLDSSRTFFCEARDHFQPRCPMYSTLVNSHPSQFEFLVFGGRGSPKQPTNRLFSLSLNSFSKNSADFCPTECNFREIIPSDGKIVPAARWRHSATMLRSNSEQSFMVVFGGRDETKVFDDCWKYDLAKEEWSLIKLNGEIIYPRHSHSVCVANHYSMSLLLSGGLNERQLPYNDVFEITFAVDFQEAYVKRLQFPLVPRYSHTSHIVKNKLFLVGGVVFCPTSRSGCNVSTDVVDVFELSTGACLHSFNMKDSSDLPMILHNHSSFFLHNQHGNDSKSSTSSCAEARDNHLHLFIIGGGDNCFSFGTWFNRTPIHLDLLI